MTDDGWRMTDDGEEEEDEEEDEDEEMKRQRRRINRWIWSAHGGDIWSARFSFSGGLQGTLGIISYK